MFQNPEIDLADLPRADDLEWQALHAAFKKRLRVHMAIVVMIMAVAFAIPMFIPGVPIAVIATLWTSLAIVTTAMMTWPALAVPRRGYAVRDKDIVFRKGILWRSVTAIPFNRIQHVETSSDPLDRRFDLATLQLFTAGGSSGDLKIDGLGKDVAENLRGYILKKIGAIVENA